MKLKIYKNPICILWVLKVIFDMFYQAKVLSIGIIGFAFALTIQKLIKLRSFRIQIEDAIVFVVFFLFSISYIKSPREFPDYIKIVSSFSLYVLGRLYVNDMEKVWDTLANVLLFAFLVNAMVCLFGGGALLWGDAKTIRGLYYFKTDFAVMLLFFIISTLFGIQKLNLINKMSVTIAIVLIFLTNARIAYLLVLITLLLYYQFRTNGIKKILLFKTVLLMIIAFVAALYGLRMLSNTNFFQKMGFISLNFNSITDLMSSGNTQGRNTIWTILLEAFRKEPYINRLFGTGLDFNNIHGISGLNEHSTYIKVLLNTGYFGLLMFILFIILITIRLSKTKNKRWLYYSLSVWIVFLVTGISVPSITFTSYSWLPMFMIGATVSKVDRERRKSYDSNRQNCKCYCTGI